MSFLNYLAGAIAIGCFFTIVAAITNNSVLWVFGMGMLIGILTNSILKLIELIELKNQRKKRK